MISDLILRKEAPGDIPAVQEVIEEAFRNAEHTNGREGELTLALRKSSDFIPDLSIVAEVQGEIVGHILFSKIQIVSGNQVKASPLALAPLSVLPRFQKNGIGGALIRLGHQIAGNLGHTSVIVVGHPAYYPKFGYVKASSFGIKAPFDVPDEAFMAIELKKGALLHCAGVVHHPPEFGLP